MSDESKSPKTEASPTGLEEAPHQAASAPAKQGSKKLAGKIIGWSATLVALCLSIVVARKISVHPQSHDAVVKANVIGIAPRVSGPIRKIYVKDDQEVKKGDVLFEIDPEPFQWAVKTAHANVETVDGELANAGTGIQAQTSQAKASQAALAKAKTLLNQTTDTYNRLAPLAKDKFVTAEMLDNARSARDAAAATVLMAESEVAAATSAIKTDAPLHAKRHAMEALLGQAELALKDCTVRAPIDGRVVGLRISEGAFAITGASILTMIDTQDWHIEANFLETDLRHIQPGAEVRLEIMTDPGRLHTGRVVSIGSGVSTLPELPPTLSSLPVVRRELDWVRLAQRFPVRIRIEPAPPEEVLRIGAVVSATVIGKP